MRRHILYTFLIIFMLPAKLVAQPLSVLNNYTYNENPEHKIANIIYSPLTKTYLASCYNGKVFQLKNNKVQTIDLPLNPVAFQVIQLGIDSFLVCSSHDISIFNSGNKQVIYHNDYDMVSVPVLKSIHSIWFTTERNKMQYLYNYKDYTLTLLDSAKFLQVKKSNGNILIAKSTNGNKAIIQKLVDDHFINVSTFSLLSPFEMNHFTLSPKGKFIHTTKWLNGRLFNTNLFDSIHIVGSIYNDNSSILIQQTPSEEHKKLIFIDTPQIFNIENPNMVGPHVYNHSYKFLLLGSNEETTQYFLHIKKYPKLFSYNSKNIFTLNQLDDSSIVVAQYEGKICQIIKGKKNYSQSPYMILNGSLQYSNGMLFSTETVKKDLYYYKNNRILHIAIPNITHAVGFYFYKSSKDILYFGTANNGIYFNDIKNCVSSKSSWRKISRERLGDIENILTITEDKLGRIWFGHPRKGIGIYTPYKDSVQLFLMSNNKTQIGALSSVTDLYGNVWIGTGFDGLYVVNGNKNIITLQDFKKIKHPFFTGEVKITAMTIHGNYLILNAYDKTLVLDLEQFHQGKINLKYLTAKESNYTSFTEQNTLLVAKDSTVWFSTSDMLYQWDFRSWLNIPKEKITIYTTIQTKEKLDTIQQQIKLNPFQNSFKVDINYYHPDLLPRYFSFALQYENDSIIYSKLTTNSTLQYTNLAQGKYKLYVQVMELNGTISKYQYNITIDTIWYKKWWVITLFCFVALGLVLFFYSLLQSKKKAELLAKNKALELENIKSNTNLELSQLKVQSLANQIRPHFLLNTINTIGASIKERKAEKLLDNLANSINLLFNQSISGKNVHSLQQEWQICKNIIEIYISMYLPELKLIVKGYVLSNENIQVPFGIMQIPVENALQHGLRNKLSSPYELKVQFDDIGSNFQITVMDNGIGITNSEHLSNARKHGTGVKNIKEIIEIFNGFNNEKITFNIEENKIDGGTTVIIYLPHNYNYDINK